MFPSDLRLLPGAAWAGIPHVRKPRSFENVWRVDRHRLESPALLERRGTGLFSRPELSLSWK